MSRRLKLYLLVVVMAFQMGGFAWIIYGYMAAETGGEKYYLQVRFKALYSSRRGRYLQLGSEFTDRTYKAPADNRVYRTGDLVYVLFDRDENGFISPRALAGEPPGSQLYLRARLSRHCGDVWLKAVPILEHFYIREDIADDAKKILDELAHTVWAERDADGSGDSRQDTRVWLELRIREGNAAMIDLHVDGVPVAQAVQEYRAREAAQSAREDGVDGDDSVGDTGAALAESVSGRGMERGEDERRDGPWKAYYEDGRLEEMGYYRDGAKDGLWEYYDGEGRLKGKQRYKNGKREGLWEGYHADGPLQETGTYKDGKKDGLWRFYGEDGQLEREERYEAGERTPGR